MASQQQQQHTGRSSKITAIVKIFLGVTGTPQKGLMVPLGLSESGLSRKMRGEWTADDLDILAEFFGVAVSDFFEDPEVIRRRMLGLSDSPWIPTLPGQTSISDLLDTAA